MNWARKASPCGADQFNRYFKYAFRIGDWANMDA